MTGETELQLQSLILLTQVEGMGLVVLTNTGRDRQIGIPCTEAMINRLNRITDTAGTAPMQLPQLLCRLLGDHGIAEVEIHITDVSDGNYVTLLYDRATLKTYTVAPDDAVALALAGGWPIYIRTALFASQSVAYKPGQEQMAMPLNVLNGQLLERALQRAIAREDYEMAKAIKDEIGRRGKNDDKR